MSAIKYRDTKPEMFIRKLLYANGYRYRVNYCALPGKPDIYLSKYRTAIFVNGCFWHRHENCKYAYMPKSNAEFWEQKLNGNRERDRRKYTDLIARGIRIIVIWECTVEKMMKQEGNRQSLLSELNNFFGNTEWSTEL